MDTLLKFIMQEMEVSVLMHLLIALSYLCKQKFQREMEEANVRKRISEFMHYYENTYPAGIY
jgi:hypothetical protein